MQSHHLRSFVFAPRDRLVGSWGQHHRHAAGRHASGCHGLGVNEHARGGHRHPRAGRASSAETTTPVRHALHRRRQVLGLQRVCPDGQRLVRWQHPDRRRAAGHQQRHRSCRWLEPHLRRALERHRPVLGLQRLRPARQRHDPDELGDPGRRRRIDECRRPRRRPEPHLRAPRQRDDEVLGLQRLRQPRQRHEHPVVDPGRRHRA